jgi:hypothetical protein
MSNSYLHKKQKLLFAPQATVGTAVTPTSSTYVVPAEDISFDLSRGSLNIDRAGINFGGPGSVQSKRGSTGWGISFTSEIHGSTLALNPSLAPLLSCGLVAVNETGDTVYRVARGCSLAGQNGSLPEGPGCATMWLVEDCGVTRKAQDVTGTAVINLEAGERATVSYTMVGRVLQGTALQNSVINTTSTELGFGATTGWGLPYVVTAITAKIDGEDPVNLQSLAFDLGMDVSDIGDPLAVGGLGITKPELQDSVLVSFNVAQDANNRSSFWTKFFNDGKITVTATLTGPDGSTIELSSQNLRHDPVSTEDVNSRRHYGISAKCFIDPTELGTLDAAYANMFKMVFTPASV